MLGNRKLILDTYCEVYDLLRPWMDLCFYNFSKLTIETDAIYMIGRAQFNLNLEKVRNIVDSKQAIIIVSNPAEGSETLKHHMQRAGFDEYTQDGKLLLLGGGDMEPKYQYLQYDSFLPKVYDYEENIIECQRTPEIYANLNKPYKFLFLNGRSRPHRKFLIQSFAQLGMLDHAIWTNLDSHIGRTQDITLIYQGQDLIAEKIPIKLLDSKYEIDRYCQNLSQPTTEKFVKNELFQSEWGDIYLKAEPYIDTYFSVVTETIFTYPYSFRTEKIWKPIAIGHPWIAVANEGFYRDIKNLGFRTFDKLIDESFDNITDNLDRLQRIKDVIIDLYNSDLPSFIKSAREICEYNQQHLSEMRIKVREEFPNRYRQFMIDQGIINE
jgi:hypothetical protein